jgi:hypothetical protein
VKRWDRGEETAQDLSLRRTELPHGLRTRFLATFVEPVGPSLAATAPSIVTLSNVMSFTVIPSLSKGGRAERPPNCPSDRRPRISSTQPALEFLAEAPFGTLAFWIAAALRS